MCLQCNIKKHSWYNSDSKNRNKNTKIIIKIWNYLVGFWSVLTFYATTLERRSSAAERVAVKQHFFIIGAEIRGKETQQRPMNHSGVHFRAGIYRTYCQNLFDWVRILLRNSENFWREKYAKKKKVRVRPVNYSVNYVIIFTSTVPISFYATRYLIITA